MYAFIFTFIIQKIARNWAIFCYFLTFLLVIIKAYFIFVKTKGSDIEQML